MVFPVSISLRLAVVATIFLGIVPGNTSQLEPYTETIPGTLITFDLVPIPGGSLSVANPENLDIERILKVDDIWIGKTEVTWEEYDVWQLGLDHEPAKRRQINTESRPSRPYGAPDWGFGHSGFATISVTVHAAEEYARWLSEKTGKNYRLPTTDEWQYACYLGIGSAPVRERTTMPNLNIEDRDAIAWHLGNSDRATHAVASKKPSALGVYDMLGNAGEWGRDKDGATALLGGSYQNEATNIHCGARAEQTRAWNSTDPQIPKSTWWLSDAPFAGFRIIRDPEGEESVR